MHRPSLSRAIHGPSTNAGHAGTSPMRAPKAPRRRSRGQALVEFAIVLPVFLLVLSGVLDFGFLFYSRMSAINAIREGAENGALQSGPSTTWSQMKTSVSGVITADANGVPLGSPTFQLLTLSAPSTWVSATNPSGTTLMSALKGDAVQVTATYQYHTFFPLLFGTTIPVTVTTQMVIYPPSS